MKNNRFLNWITGRIVNVCGGSEHVGFVQKLRSLSKDYIGQVKEFHELFNQPVKDTIGLPNQDRQQLRLSLIREEFGELCEAVEQDNFVEVVDALCDLQYVLSGTILEFGLKDRFDEYFAETHRSNMSKACKTLDEAVKTVEHYEGLNQPCYWEQVKDGFLVYRKSDGKVLKSVNYSPVNYQL